MNEKSVFIFVGKSGCGKGTQASLLREFINRVEIDNNTGRKVFDLQSGEGFRKFIKGETYTQGLARKIYDEGGLEPEFLAIMLWSNMLSEEYNGNDHILIDGTPRIEHEALVLDSTFPFYGLKNIFVIHIDVSDGWAEERLLGRGRSDDNKEDIKNRLEWFETNVLKVIKFFKTDKKYKYLKIDGEREIEVIHKDILEKVGLR